MRTNFRSDRDRDSQAVVKKAMAADSSLSFFENIKLGVIITLWVQRAPRLNTFSLFSVLEDRIFKHLKMFSKILNKSNPVAISYFFLCVFRQMRLTG